MSQTPKDTSPTQVPCPMCGKPAKWRGNPWRPFCSERCRTLDRANWATESYAIPSEDSPSSELPPRGEDGEE